MPIFSWQISLTGNCKSLMFVIKSADWFPESMNRPPEGIQNTLGMQLILS
jgi:hypothetical protein